MKGAFVRRVSHPSLSVPGLSNSDLEEKDLVGPLQVGVKHPLCLRDVKETVLQKF